MELDVHLTKADDETWGFCLIGGVDFNMPLTIVKVLSNSPATRFGLRNGDTVNKINGAPTDRMTHEEARDTINAADDLTIEIIRGLYDPVLDDYEPIYEPIEPDGSDQPSLPTEVHFQIQNFSESPPLPEGYESRSLTASPFQLPIKPYRPFSTEPIPVPPLEDPIILNPNYRDDFCNLKVEDEKPPETKFKLPISEQYDPDGTKKQKKILETKNEMEDERIVKEKHVKEERMTKDEVKYMEEMKKEIDLEKMEKTVLKEEKMIKDEISYMEQMKKETDLEKIEKTATNIVDESLEKAKTVAEEIKKEIEVELDTTFTDIKSSKEKTVEESKIDTIIESKEYKKEFEAIVDKKEATKEVKELVEIMDKTTDEIMRQSDSKINEKVAEEIKKYDVIDKEDKVLEERRMLTKQEIEETIVAGSVKRKSMVFEKEPVKTLNLERKRSVDISVKEDKKEVEERATEKIEIDRSIFNGVKSSEAAHRSYTIGLQTIPNIRGSVRMSYHQEMLLKTFFIHLTDVMVALSRFILMEPTNRSSQESQVMRDFAYERVREESIRTDRDLMKKTEDKKVEVLTQRAEDRRKEERVQKAEDFTKEKVVEVKHMERKDDEEMLRKHVDKEVVKDIRQEIKEDIKDKLAVEEQREVIEKRKLSGARMAQLSEKKSEELTQKMEAVISEFQNKTGIETEGKELMIRRDRRSRSRSQIEEEVAREIDPLEWLAKVDSRRASAEVTEITSNKKEFSNFYESMSSKKVDTKYEAKRFKATKPKEGKNMYVAIVEAHVYTNKDAIFEEHLEEMSETASVQSAEETKVAHEISEAVVSEKVALQSSAVMKEQAEFAMEKSHQLKRATREATVQFVKETDVKKFEEIKIEEMKMGLNIQKVEAMKSVELVEPIQIQEVVKSEMVEEMEAKRDETFAVAKTSEINQLKKAAKEVTVQFVKESDIEKVEEIKVKEIKLELDIKKFEAKPTVETVQPIQIQEVVKSEMTEEIKEKKKETLAIAKQSEIGQLKKAVTEATVQFVDTKTEETKVEEAKTGVDIKDFQTKHANKIIEVIEPIQVQEVVELEMADEIKAKKEKSHCVAEMSEVSELKKDEVKVHKTEIMEPKVEIQEMKKSEEISMKEETVGIVTEVAEISAEVKKEQTVQIEEITEKEEEVLKKVVKAVQPKDEFAELHIIKQEVTEVETEYYEIGEDIEVRMMKEAVVIEAEVDDFEAQMSKLEETSLEKSVISQEGESRTELGIQSQELTHETSTGTQGLKSTEIKEFSTHTDLTQNNVLEISSEVSSPTTVPATPLVDEYVFRLDIPLPKSKNTTPIPREPKPKPEPAPESQNHDEDPHIVKKKLVPSIDTSVEQVVYNPPSSTPEQPKPRPKYTKPGLRGGGDRQELTKEEILEIGRKSSLLASAIDETIKSIEEYKEEVGIESKKELKVQHVSKTEVVTAKSTKLEEHTVTKEMNGEPIMYNGYSKVIESNTYDAGTIDNNEKTEIKSNNEIKISKEDESELSKNESTIVVDKEVKINREVTEAVEKDETMLCEEKVQVETKDSKTENGEVTSEEVVQIEKISTKNDESVKIETKIQEQEESVKIEKSEEKVQEETRMVEEPPTKECAPKETPEKMDTTQKLEVTVNGSLDQEVDKTKVEKTERKITEEIATEETSEATKTIEKETETTKSETVVKEKQESEKKDPLKGYKPVHFDPEKIQKKHNEIKLDSTMQETSESKEDKPVYVTETGEILGTIQGIVDGLEEAVVDEEVAKELGKPGMPEEKIAEIISGESEMLREAHVMGLSRVLSSHMHRVTDEDDSSVDFKKIKPLVESLKDSEVLKALNEEEIEKAQEKKKKEERKWSAFLQKPKKPVPKARYGYYGYIEKEKEVIEEPYKVKIIKQPKPKIAPDFKPENFDTGPLPWEERAQIEQLLPPVPIEPEEPILIPEELPQFLEAVDPLPESEVPDLEDTGIPLPPEQPREQPPTPVPEIVVEQKYEEEPVQSDIEAVVEKTERIAEEMDQERLAEQLMRSVQSLVDPNASVEQQLAQMRVQLAALAQLPGVIQQTLELVMRRISQLSQQEAMKTTQSQTKEYNSVNIEDIQNNNETMQEQNLGETQQTKPEQNGVDTEEEVNTDQMVETVEDTIDEVQTESVKEDRNEESEETNVIEEEPQRTKKEHEMTEEEKRIEKLKKDMERLEYEGRLVKQRPTPRPGKPKPVFGPLNPLRPVVLPGGRRWRRPQDVYDEQLIAETLNANAEIIKGKAKGINFMKYEKPPVSLDHLQRSDVYKLIHNMEQSPVKRVELLTPVIAESDYREKCRSLSPCADRMSREVHQNIPQQVQP